MMIVSGLAATAAAADSAPAAPSAISGSVLAAVRFQTHTPRPCASRARAIAEPMSPAPSTVTSDMRHPSLRGEPAVDDEDLAGHEVRRPGGQEDRRAGEVGG